MGYPVDETAPAPLPAARREDPSSTGRPLVVDLDGTLVSTDTMIVSMLAVARRPFSLMRAVFALRHGRARLKQALAVAADLDAALLPYNRELLAYLREQRARGRLLVLATGADRKTAEAVARHLDLFDRVLASDGRTNLTRRAKLAAIRHSIGDAPFTYVGNSRADLAVWSAAASGICVNAPRRVARAAARATVIERSFSAEAGWIAALLRAIRQHPREVGPK
jgi:phosphoglycolate phosphatase-like HAD superfamily hydrolase